MNQAKKTSRKHEMTQRTARWQKKIENIGIISNTTRKIIHELVSLDVKYGDKES